MRRLRIFLRLPRAEQLLLLGALLVVAAIRAGLSLLHFQRVRGMVERVARPRARAISARRMTPERLARTVTTVAAYVPGASCLTQALALRALLTWQGYPCELRIGVAKDAGGTLEAHAWVVEADRILIGGPAEHVARFTPLPITGRI